MVLIKSILSLIFSGGRTHCKVSGTGAVITEDRVESDFLQDRCLGGAGGESRGEGHLHLHPVSGSLSSLPVEEQA